MFFEIEISSTTTTEAEIYKNVPINILFKLFKSKDFNKPAEIDINTAYIIGEVWVNAHPIPIPNGPVLENMMIILMERFFLDSFLLKLIPFSKKIFNLLNNESFTRVKASAHLCKATATNKFISWVIPL